MIIDESVTTIENNDFERVINLVSITMSDSVKKQERGLSTFIHVCPSSSTTFQNDAVYWIMATNEPNAVSTIIACVLFSLPLFISNLQTVAVSL